MKRNRTGKSRRSSSAKRRTPIRAACEALGISIAATLLLSALCAVLIYNSILPLSAANACGRTISCAATFAGAFHAANRAAARKLLTAFGVCAGYVLLLLLCNVIFIEGAPVGLLRTLIPSLISTAAAAVLCIGAKQSRVGKRR